MWATLVAIEAADKITVSTNVKDWVNQHGLNILIILLGAWLFRHFSTVVVSKIIHRTIRHDLFPTEIDRKKRIDTLNSLVGTSMRIGVWLIASVMIIDELGINTAPLLASASVLGITLGLGAQSLIKDFVSGVFIIVENQYRVGDIVELGTVSGIVEAITIRTTILRDLDGNLHHIPNGAISITTNKTIEFSSLNEDIVVARDTDLDRLEHIVNHVGEEMAAAPIWKDKLKESPYLARVKNFDENGIAVKILGRTGPGEQWKVKSELYRRLKKAFREHGIEVAYQQVVIHHPNKK